MAEWWEREGEVSKSFGRARDTVPGGNPAFLTHSDEQLESWREHLIGERERPKNEPHLTIGGSTEQAAHERAAEEREKLIREIEAEQYHRLMLERDRERAHQERGDDDHER